jgi:hypothetical protein
MVTRARRFSPRIDHGRKFSLASWRNGIAVAILSITLAGLPIRGHAEGLECPEIGAAAIKNLLADSTQAKLVTSGNSVDVANEIYDLINRVQIEEPNISYAELTNVLIATYCQAVAKVSDLSAAEKWRRMQQFDAIVRQQLAANMMPAGSLIIANVPLPPSVYRELRSQAATVHQTPAQLMAGILTQAAGR